MTRNVISRFLTLSFLAMLSVWASNAQTIGSGGANVLTWHNDVGRTGQNLSEIVLVPTGQGAVSSTTFGQLCSVQLDGQVYAQPLIVTSVKLQGSSQAQTVVYVVTENDTLYAINGTPPGTSGNTCTILNGPTGTSLLRGPLASQSPAACGNVGSKECQTIAPNIGILGTPVISLNTANNTGTIYVVTETQDSSLNFYHYLHAIDITTFNEVDGGPVRIAPQTACDSADLTTTIFSQKHIQRPGVLYVAGTGGADNYLYIGFSMMDGVRPLPNGLIFEYDVSQSLRTQTSPPCFPTTPGGTNSEGGGVWQGGAGLAYGMDKASGGSDYIYFGTGNGDFSTTQKYFADSFVKLNPSPTGGLLTYSDYFTPSDWVYRDCSGGVNNQYYTDADFGSGGVMLVPEAQFTYSGKYVAVSGDKEGILFAMDRGSPGEYNSANSCSTSCSPPVPCSPTQEANGNLGALWPTAKEEIHNTPAFWSGTAKDGATNNIYLAAINGTMMEYPLGPVTGCSDPICAGTTLPTDVTQDYHLASFLDGSTPSVSANGSTGGIIWAIWADGSFEPDSVKNGTVPAAQPGVLFALDPLAATELYGSDFCISDFMNPATKFSVPTVANGYVYVGTQGPLCNNSGGTCNFNNGAFYVFGKFSSTRICP